MLKIATMAAILVVTTALNKTCTTKFSEVRHTLSVQHNQQLLKRCLKSISEMGYSEPH